MRLADDGQVDREANDFSSKGTLRKTKEKKTDIKRQKQNYNKYALLSLVLNTLMSCVN